MRRTVRATGAVNVGPIGGKSVPSAAATTNAVKGFSPTVLNLLVILIIEIAVFSAIRYAFRVIQK